MCLSDRRRHKCPLAEEENDMETKADNMVEVAEEEEEVGFHQVAPPVMGKYTYKRLRTSHFRIHVEMERLYLAQR